jgi:hypothetical protein
MIPNVTTELLMSQSQGPESTSNTTTCTICMDQFNLLYTCGNQLCKALYCRVCIKRWLATDNCPKVCALCKSTTVLTVAQNTTSVPTDLTITLTSVENATLHTVEGFIAPTPVLICQPTSRKNVIASQLLVHFLIHLVFIYRLSTKHGTLMLVIYYVFMTLHLLWLVAIRTQYYQRMYTLAVLAMAAPVGLLLCRLGIVVIVLPSFEVPMISILSTLACIVDIATCWTYQ